MDDDDESVRSPSPSPSLSASPRRASIFSSPAAAIGGNSVNIVAVAAMNDGDSIQSPSSSPSPSTSAPSASIFRSPRPTPETAPAIGRNSVTVVVAAMEDDGDSLRSPYPSISPSASSPRASICASSEAAIGGNSATVVAVRENYGESPRSHSPPPSPSQNPPPPLRSSISSAVATPESFRNAVTVAVASVVPHLPPPPLAVGIPIQTLRSAAAHPPPSLPPRKNGEDLARNQEERRSSRASSGREDCWSEGATAALIDAWSERFTELRRGSLKQKHWQEVADAVCSRDGYTKTPKSDLQCKNRIDTLKKKYKNEKAKASSNWPFFHRLDHLLSPIYKPSPRTFPLPPPVVASFAQKPRTPGIRKRRLTAPPPPPTTPAATNAGEAKREAEGVGESSESGLPPRNWGCGKRRRGEGMREVAKAVAQFGEVYERMERSTVEMAEESERRRVSFTKEMEVQRLKFFAQVQMEISGLKSRHGGDRDNGTRGHNELRRGGNNMKY